MEEVVLERPDRRGSALRTLGFAVDVLDVVPDAFRPDESRSEFRDVPTFEYPTTLMCVHAVVGWILVTYRGVW
jgi:hypothetical protein